MSIVQVTRKVHAKLAYNTVEIERMLIDDFVKQLEEEGVEDIDQSLIRLIWNTPRPIPAGGPACVLTYEEDR